MHTYAPKPRAYQVDTEGMLLYKTMNIRMAYIFP